MATNYIGSYGYNPQGSSLISQLGLIPSQPQPAATPMVPQRPVTPAQPKAAAAPQAPGFNFQEAINKAMQMSQQAFQPSINALQQGIGQTQQAFSQARSNLEARRAPLQERYASLINDIKAQGEQRAAGQTKVTNAELARRGVMGNLAEQSIQDAISPIQQQTQALTKDTGLQGELAQLDLENLIANLTGQEAQQLQGIQGNIANLQSGIGSNAIQNALAQLQLQENARQFNVGRQISPYQQATLDIARSGSSSPNSANILASLWESL